MNSTMTGFNFDKFLLDERISLYRLSKVTKINYDTLLKATKRGTIKTETLGIFEDSFKKKLDRYIVN